MIEMAQYANGVLREVLARKTNPTVTPADANILWLLGKFFDTDIHDTLVFDKIIGNLLLI